MVDTLLRSPSVGSGIDPGSEGAISRKAQNSGSILRPSGDCDDISQTAPGEPTADALSFQRFDLHHQSLYLLRRYPSWFHTNFQRLSNCGKPNIAVTSRKVATAFKR